MRQVILAWLKTFSKFLAALLSTVAGRRRVLELVTEAAENDDDFITYHSRPKMAIAVGTQSDVWKDCKPTAIILQGPIVHKNAFTLETIKIYQRHFPETNLILSTWEDETPVATKRFEDMGVRVVLNQKPAYVGVSNINLQIVSSRSGVLEAKKMGVEYALKTRTDQRMYSPNLLGFFYNLTEIFPVRGNWPKQRRRIVGCSLNTFKYRMYGLSDMLVYGQIDDMLLYWDIGLDERVFDEIKQRQAVTSLRSFALWRVCEVYLATEFLTKIGRDLKWSLHDSWAAFAEHFCIIDREQLDHFWPKYNHREYVWRRYDKDVKSQELTFNEWLNLYSNLPKLEIPESILDAPFKQ